MIPGVMEPEELKERQIHLDNVEAKLKTDNFFTGMKITLRDKHFVGFLTLFTCYSITMGMVMSGIPWFVSDILELSALGELAFLPYVIAVPITAPFWYKLGKKIGIRKVTLMGGSLLGISSIMLIFVPPGFIGFVIAGIVAGLTGLVDGAMESMVMPVFSSIVDNHTLKTKKRKEGLYRGVMVFFQRLSFFIGFFLLWIIQMFFGYDHNLGADNTFIAKLGFRFYMSLFPLIIMSIGAIAFWKFYRLSKEELEKNIKELEVLNI
jgi:Na+/melibiose symporter-like transporter